MGNLLLVSVFAVGAALVPASAVAAADTSDVRRSQAAVVGDAPTATEYTLVQMGLLRRHSGGTVNAINDGGVAVGAQQRQSSPATTPVVWRSGKPRALSLPSGASSARALGISNKEVIVGVAIRRSDRESHAVRWVDGRARWLPVPPDEPDNFLETESSWASGVNEHGIMVGQICQVRCLAAAWDSGGAGYRHASTPLGAQASEINESDVAVGGHFPATAFTWGVDTSSVGELPLPAGAQTSWAYGINDAGTAVGTVGTPMQSDGYSSRAVSWTNGVATLLPPPTATDGGLALSINNAGDIVGETTDFAVPYRPLLWTAGEVRYLPVPDSGAEAHAADINSEGTVAGQMSGRPVLWRK